MSEQPSPPKNKGLDVAWILLIGLAVVAVTVVTLLVLWQPDTNATDASGPLAGPERSPGAQTGQPPYSAVEPPASELSRLDEMIMNGKATEAASELKQLRAKHPTSAAVVVLAARAAEMSGDRAQAIELYDQVPESNPRWYRLAIFESAVVRLRDGDFDGAEARLRRVLQWDPNHLGAHEQLARLLSLEGRRWESAPHLYALIRAGQADMRHLNYAGNLFAPIDEPELLQAARKAHPNQWLAELGLARIDFKNADWTSAEKRLKAVLDHRPDVLEAHVAFGELLAEQGRWSEVPAWNKKLSSDAESHPVVWWLRGRWAEAAGQRDAAIRCYWESMRRYGGDRRPCYRLAKLLVAAGQAEAANAYLAYAKKLDQLAEIIWLNFTSEPGVERLLQTAKIAEELGRYLESKAWYYFALQLDTSSEEAQQGFIRLQELATAIVQPVAPGKNPAQRFPFGDQPLPDWSRATPSQLAGAQSAPAAAIQFRESAADWGLDFRIHNGDDPDQPGFHLWQAFGGGVSVTDYDGDGWPDLYAVQENENPLAPSPDHVDRLYRNLGGDRYEDVTAVARINAFGFGQSAAVGDYNGDGFADLLIANIGGNQLWRNEGDGTFTQVTDQVPFQGDRWTTCAALADLNGDGFDDILLVNYLKGPEPLTKQCKSGELPTACRPTIFDPERDELYWNNGDGTFSNGELEAEPGRGLGLVVADLDADGKVDVFVANDMTANHLYWNELADLRPIPFRDSGLISGVGVDGEGRSQACMGIALGDVNGDQRPDLFVTNFFQESNTLYAQFESRVFSDQTAAAQLRDPSVPLLGFGTQFIDFDLDGWLDTMIANGLIDQPPDTEYRMPTQVFRNRGGGVFEEIAADQLGDYFAGRYLGRGLAAMDADRDGRPDVAISHLDAPLALLMNTTKTSHHFVSLRLTSKDHLRCVGAVIEVTAGGKTYRRDVTAGDGYAAANDRRVVIGLGAAQSIERIQIQWPGGATQVWVNVAPDRHWIAVEGSRALLEWPGEWRGSSGQHTAPAGG